MLFSPADGSNLRATRLGLLFTLVFAAASAGCGQRACIEWSTQEGVCPSPTEAPTHIGTCTNIVSVDGEGTHEGNLCCYPVTKQGPLPDCFVDPSTSSGLPPPPPDSVSTGFFSCDNQNQCGNFTFGCSSCALNDLCWSAVNVCQSTSACSSILTCVTSCFEGDTQCTKQCEDQNPKGAADFRNLTSCVYCGECHNDCFSHASECGLPPTSGGGMGGMGGAGGMSGMGGMVGMDGMSGVGGAGGKGGAGGTGGMGGKSAGP
jgi:hypothetical protein